MEILSGPAVAAAGKCERERERKRERTRVSWYSIHVRLVLLHFIYLSGIKLKQRYDENFFLYIFYFFKNVASIY